MGSQPVERYLAKWLSGDERAYKGVFDYYYPKLFSAGYRVRKNTEECEEMAMNVLLKIWQYKAGIRQINNLEYYLYGMLRQEISRLVRKNILQTQEFNLTDDAHQAFADTDTQFSLKELQRRYTLALQQIPPKRLEIFLMSREQGYSYQQIADHHNLSVNTVRNQIAAALKLLKNELHEYSDILPALLLITLFKP